MEYACCQSAKTRKRAWEKNVNRNEVNAIHGKRSTQNKMSKKHQNFNWIFLTFDQNVVYCPFIFHPLLGCVYDFKDIQVLMKLSIQQKATNSILGLLLGPGLRKKDEFVIVIDISLKGKQQFIFSEWFLLCCCRRSCPCEPCVSRLTCTLLVRWYCNWQDGWDEDE